MSVLRSSRDFILPHFCLLHPSYRPLQHRRATTLRRLHEMRSTVADWSHPNLSHNHGRGSSSDDDDQDSIRRFPTPWLSSSSQPPSHPDDRLPDDTDRSPTSWYYSIASCLRCRWLAYWLPPSRPTFFRLSYLVADCVRRLPSLWLRLIASLLAPLFILISAADVRQTSSRSSRGTWPHEGIGPKCVGKPPQRPVARSLSTYQKVQALSLTVPWRELFTWSPSTSLVLYVGRRGHGCQQVPQGARPVRAPISQSPTFTSTTSALSGGLCATLLLIRDMCMKLGAALTGDFNKGVERKAPNAILVFASSSGRSGNPSSEEWARERRRPAIYFGLRRPLAQRPPAHWSWVGQEWVASFNTLVSANSSGRGPPETSIWSWLVCAEPSVIGWVSRARGFLLDGWRRWWRWSPAAWRSATLENARRLKRQ